MEGTNLTDLCSFKNRHFVRFWNFQIEIGRDFTLNRIFKTELETKFLILVTFFRIRKFHLRNETEIFVNFDISQRKKSQNLSRL